MDPVKIARITTAAYRVGKAIYDELQDVDRTVAELRKLEDHFRKWPAEKAAQRAELDRIFKDKP